MLKLPYKLILASNSPRRAQLLRESGFCFEVFPSNADEEFPSNLSPPEVALQLAIQKAEAVSSLFDLRNTVILAADTIVVLDKAIIGKPLSTEDATNILSRLSGREHSVFTGFCLRGLRNHDEVVRTDVLFNSLTEREIEYYLDYYKPFDKAGSYGVQEWLGHCKINGIRGSYTNVMGLPMSELYAALSCDIAF